ncbi:hypothetical protein QQS21_000732 [Conoideocrella luteorostrata]|uniref:Zn(2)-C6 fungal-type domain-containing protein n=1 Tax=Conoideocrella luteorostrata TaxID=1105319 RepID=A0AAJ0G3U2_9HYPO|nr:hypothetical protein QQS21_000732 [Conoideocrella luteorostrata]
MDYLILGDGAQVTGKRKRGRAQKSCNFCHGRRRHCDQRRPACGRCTSSGLAGNCVYLDDIATNHRRLADECADRQASATDQTLDDVERVLRCPDSAFRHEESQRNTLVPDRPLIDRSPSPDSSGEFAETSLLARRSSPLASSAAALPDSSVGIQSGAFDGPDGHFGIRWSGATSIDDLMQAIPGLESFANDTFQNYPAIDRIRGHMGKVTQYRQDCHILDPARDAGGLRLMLPSKQQVDYRIRLFLDTYGKIYHIFHLPSFWKDYNRLWDHRRGCRPRFIAIVLLMVAASRGLDPATACTPSKKKITADDAMRYIESCEAWLRSQKTTQTDTEDLQLRFSLVFAKVVVLPKFKTSWVEAQNVVQMCICAGLHRDPDAIRAPLSELEKELRRRVWYAAIELQIQVCVDRGMMPLPLPPQCDCRPPRNIHDSELLNDEDLLPQTRAVHATTDVAYLAAAAESMPFRYKLSEALNRSQERFLSSELANNYTGRIHEYLDKLPRETNFLSDVSKPYLVLNLQQYLFMIHAPRAQCEFRKSGRQFSCMILWQTALETMRIHKALWSDKQFALQALCNDYLRAGLCLSQILTAAHTAHEGDFEPTVAYQAAILVRDAIEMASDRMIRFGRERRSLFMLLAAREYFFSQRDSSRRETCMKNVVSGMIDTCQKAIECKALEAGLIVR